MRAWSSLTHAIMAELNARLSTLLMWRHGTARHGHASAALFRHARAAVDGQSSLNGTMSNRAQLPPPHPAPPRPATVLAHTGTLYLHRRSAAIAAGHASLAGCLLSTGYVGLPAWWQYISRFTSSNVCSAST